MSSSLGPVSSGNRFSTLTPDDHGGIIWTVSLIGAVYSFLMLGARFYIKRNNIGIDDVFCVTATVSR